MPITKEPKKKKNFRIPTPNYYHESHYVPIKFPMGSQNDPSLALVPCALPLSSTLGVAYMTSSKEETTIYLFFGECSKLH